MDKTATSTAAIEEIIARRWSPRAFSPQLVDHEDLRCALEAARWAASCYNEQPWRFLIASHDDPTAFERLASCLVEANAWAKKAPVLMAVIARTTFTRDGQPNRHALYDTGAAMATFCIQATALGLFAHQMAGFDAGRVRRLFAVPDGYEPIAMVAVGHLGDPTTLPPTARGHESEPRTRRELHELVFHDRFGALSPLV